MGYLVLDFSIAPRFPVRGMSVPQHPSGSEASKIPTRIRRTLSSRRYLPFSCLSCCPIQLPSTPTRDHPLKAERVKVLEWNSGIPGARDFVRKISCEPSVQKGSVLFQPHGETRWCRNLTNRI